MKHHYRIVQTGKSKFIVQRKGRFFWRTVWNPWNSPTTEHYSEEDALRTIRTDAYQREERNYKPKVIAEHVGDSLEMISGLPVKL